MNANVTALVDASGNVIERYVYTPYGDVTIYDSTWTNVRGTSAYYNTILFTGRELDPQTGLYNYRARWYHAGLGTFTSRDPRGFSAGDANLYRCVGGNPISRTDPSGQIVVRPLALLENGFSECPFGAYDFTDPNGNWVSIPGFVDVFVPAWGVFKFTAIWCEYCGPWVNSVSVYYPEYNIWNQTCRLHFHIVEGYSPGPSFVGLWLELWWDNITGGNEGLRHYSMDQISILSTRRIPLPLNWAVNLGS